MFAPLKAFDCSVSRILIEQWVFAPPSARSPFSGEGDFVSPKRLINLSIRSVPTPGQPVNGAGVLTASIVTVKALAVAVMQSNKEILSCKLSLELLEAQEKLLQLRAKLGIASINGSESPLTDAPQEKGVSWAIRNAQVALQQRRLQLGIAKRAATQTDTDWPEGVQISSSGPEVAFKFSTTITVHPTIAMAILRQHLEAPARVYFLLRAIDSAGRGWLSIEHVRQYLTQKDSPVKICGWRRLRQLLREGDGIFWQRDDQDRLWLKGSHRIAYTLNSGLLQGFPVVLPTQAFLGGIQAVRAAF